MSCIADNLPLSLPVCRYNFWWSYLFKKGLSHTLLHPYSILILIEWIVKDTCELVKNVAYPLLGNLLESRFPIKREPTYPLQGNTVSILLEKRESL